MKKPLLLMLMSIVLIFSLGQSAWAFSDIQTNVNGDKIAALQKAGILSGESDELFNPDGKLTYAAGISMIVKGLDISFAKFQFNKAPQASDYFTYVKDGNWYSEGFIIAHVNGLDIPKDVKPDQVMTKEQFAHHLFRAIEANGEHAYTLQFIMIQDEADITKIYSNSIQNLLITKIASLNKEQKFFPHATITRGEAAGWLYDAIDFVKRTPSIPPQTDPESPSNPLTGLQLASKEINKDILEVTVSAQAPHPGYGIRITSITFNNNQAIIHTEPVLPNPENMNLRSSKRLKSQPISMRNTNPCFLKQQALHLKSSNE